MSVLRIHRHYTRRLKRTYHQSQPQEGDLCFQKFQEDVTQSENVDQFKIENTSLHGSIEVLDDEEPDCNKSEAEAFDDRRVDEEMFLENEYLDELQSMDEIYLDEAVVDLSLTAEPTADLRDIQPEEIVKHLTKSPSKRLKTDSPCQCPSCGLCFSSKVTLKSHVCTEFNDRKFK